MKPHPHLRKTLLASALALALSSPHALSQQVLPGTALPTGGRIAAGVATIQQAGSALTVQQSSARAALDWQSFNIGTNASVNFVQPSASAIALNRVLGGDPSQILGQLSANGQVYLTNPAGVLFGRGAQVDVGGILATTLSMSPDDFMAGRFLLRGSATNASVVNQGSLRAAPGGYVALIAPRVANEGSIEATRGSASLVAANAATVDFMADGLVRIRVDEGALDAEIANSGAIRAAGGEVLLTASALGALGRAVVNNSGIVEARTYENVNGVIRLGGGDVYVSGTLDASSATGPGGSVKVLGDRVALTGSARLDASGATGGGEVLVGGNYQGMGPEQNASITLVATGAQILADAVATGDGGTVVVWADRNTAFGGTISARGGAQGGNGGLVETSGKQNLYIPASAKVDTSAANGATGTWLLDPTNIRVVAADPGNGSFTTSLASVDQFADPNIAVAGETSIAVSSINAATSTVILQATNNITVETPIAMTALGAGLTAQAGNNINVNNSISTNNGAISLSANDVFSGGATGSGAVNVQAAMNSGNASTTLTNNGSTSPLTINANVTVGTGSLTVSSAAGGIVQNGGTISVGGGLLMSSTGPISQAGGNIVNLTGASFNLAGGSNVSLSSANNNFNTVSVSGAGNVVLNDINAVNLASSSVSGTLVVTAGGQITDSGAISAAGLTTTSVGGTVLDFGHSVTGNFNATNTGGGAITFSNTAAALTVTGISQSGGGTVTVTNTGNVNITGGVNADGDMTFQAAGGGAQDLTVTGTITGTGGPGNTLTLNADNRVLLAGATITSPVNTLHMTFNADRDGVGGGSIALDNTTIQTNNAGIVFGGGPNPASGAAIGTVASPKGVSILNSVLTNPGVAGSLTIRGQGFTTADAGIEVEDSTVTTGGVMNLYATGDLNVISNLATTLLGNSSTQALNIDATGLLLQASGVGSGTPAGIVSGGAQTITVGLGGITILGGTGGTNNVAAINLLTPGAMQTVSTSGGIQLTGGSGQGNFAEIFSEGGQFITVGSAGMTLTGGSGPSAGNSAEVNQNDAGGTQTIVLNGGGNLTLTGGTSAGSGVGFGNGSFAILRAAGVSQNVTFNGGGNVSVTGGTTGSNNFAEIISNGTQTIAGSTAITLTGGASGGVAGEGNFAGLIADGTQQIGAATTIVLQGGANGTANAARIVQNDVAALQTVSADGIQLAGGAAGGGLNNGNLAQIFSAGGQDINAGAGGLSLAGGGGGLTDNAASILQNDPGSSQTISLTGGGSITLTGGSSAGSSVGVTHGSFALIQANGTLQTVTLAGGGDISLTAGTVGSRNYAQLVALNDQVILGAPDITAIGGATGGVAGEGNLANVFAGGTQQISAGAINLVAGAGGTDNSAVMVAPFQVITASTVNLQGGGSAGTFNAARIGGTTTSPTSLALITSGSVTLTGGSVSEAAIGSAPPGGTTTDITINAGGPVVLNPGAGGARIGSPAGNLGGGNIDVGSAADIQLNSAAGIGSFIGTTGEVTLSANTISQGTSSGISASALVASALGGIVLPGNNAVDTFDAFNGGNGGITFANTATELTVTGVTQFGGGPVEITNTGNLRIAGDINVDGDVTLHARGPGAQDLKIEADIFNASGTAGRAVILRADNSVLVGAVTIGGFAEGLQLTINSDRDASGAGAIALDGTTIQLGGSSTSNIVLGGGANPPTGMAVGTAANPDGVSINNSTLAVLASTGNLSIRGQGFSALSGIKIVDSIITAPTTMTVDTTDFLEVLANTRSTMVGSFSTTSQTVNADKLRIRGGPSGTNIQAEILAGGTQTVTVGAGGILIEGGANGTNNYGSLQQVNVGGSQTVTTTGGIDLAGGFAGLDNFAEIYSEGGQSVTVGSAGLILTGGSGPSTGNGAYVVQEGAGSSQSIIMNGIGSRIELTGGSSASTSGTPFDSSAAGIFSQGTSQTITFNAAGGSISLQGGTVGSGNLAIIFSQGPQAITGSAPAFDPSISLVGGASGGVGGNSNYASIRSLDSQLIFATTVDLTGGANGTENFAGIVALGTSQAVTASNHINLTGGADGGGLGTGNRALIYTTGAQTVEVGAGGLTLTGGGGALTDNAALVQQDGVGSTQSITVNGGGAITLTGGSSAISGVGTTHGSFALIQSAGPQTVTFTSGGLIDLEAGTNGSRNYAQLVSLNDQVITGAPDISVRGGDSGGILGEGNYATVLATGTQQIDAGAINLFAGAGGTDNHAVIVAPTQVISASSVSLQGGGSAGDQAGARIGGTSTSATSLSLTTTGNITLTGGTVTGVAIGSSALAAGLNTDVFLDASGSIILNAGPGIGARIGSPSTAVTSGTIILLAGNDIALNSAGAIGTAINTIGGATLQAGGSITEGTASVIRAGVLVAQATTGIDLPGNNEVAVLGATNSGSAGITFTGALPTLTIADLEQVGGGPVLVKNSGAIAVAGEMTADGSGDALQLVGTSFFNAFGATALSTPNGRWLVWSVDPTLDTVGGLPFDFKQYGATQGVTALAQPTGNGLLYNLAPTASVSLTGTVTRAFDGTVAAPLGAGNFSVGSLQPGETATVGFSSASYADKNAGTGKMVTAGGLTVTVLEGGTLPVYGYQVAATSAVGPIGTITPAPLTVTAQTDTKAYDGTTSSGGLPSLSAGTLYGGDSVSGLVQSFASKNVLGAGGSTLDVTGYAVNDGNAGQNYSVSLLPASGTITPAPLTVTALPDSRTYDGTVASAVAPLVGGPVYDPVLVAATQAFTDKNVASGQVLNASGLLMDDGNGGLNYSISYVPSAPSGVITPRPITIVPVPVTILTGVPVPTAGTFSVVNGLGAGDALEQVLPVETTATSKSTAGTYTLTPAGVVQFTSGSPSNYTISYQDGLLTVVAVQEAAVTAAITTAVTTASSSTTSSFTGLGGGPLAPTSAEPAFTIAPAASSSSGGGQASTQAAASPRAGADASSAAIAAARAQLTFHMQELHGQKLQAVERAVRLLEEDPAIADLKPCVGGGGGDDCIAARPENPLGSRTGAGPANAFLPTIERKVALLIGINDYQGTIPKLSSPVKDVQEIGKVMQDHLGYEVRTLPNADKATMVRELNRLILESGPNDSVTVMYAGHGHLVEKTQQGYWIPANASPEDPRQWVSNNDIAKFMENISAGQIMLVSDSCYSGSLTRDAKIDKGDVLPDPQQVLARRTVTVLSSGGEEPVPDQGKEGHSVFAWHLMQQLKDIKDVSGGVNLFEQLSESVRADIPQSPQYGAGLSSGHQRGGDYLFEVRQPSPQ